MAAPGPDSASLASDLEPPTPTGPPPSVAAATFANTAQPSGSSAAFLNELGQRSQVYTSIYSSVPVFETTVRGIGVMRRRADSWMNATQILKVAGIEKGRRTKILEKDILPGPGLYEKVQGGAGKYQGTWLPIERARALAVQYGVIGLLTTIFDDNLHDADIVASLPSGRLPSPVKKGAAPPPRQMVLSTPYKAPSPLVAPSPFGAPPPPPAAKQLSPVLSTHASGPLGGAHTLTPQQPLYYPSYYDEGPVASSSSSRPMSSLKIKRRRSEDFVEEEAYHIADLAEQHRQVAAGMHLMSDNSYHNPSYDIYDRPVSSSAGLVAPASSSMAAPPQKRMRANSGRMMLPPQTMSYPQAFQQYQTHVEGGYDLARHARTESSGSAAFNEYMREGSGPFAEEEVNLAGPSRPAASLSRQPSSTGGLVAPAQPVRSSTRLATKPSDPSLNPNPALQRAVLLGFFIPSTSLRGDPSLHDPDPIDPSLFLSNPSDPFDPDLIIDPQGHTALHWACSLSRPNLVNFLLRRGADPHRGNYAGETPLVRSVLATNNFDAQSFPAFLASTALSATLRTLDNTHRSVLHHVALVAGVQGREPAARYYMESVLEWIARNEGTRGGPTGGEGFRSIIDVVDIYGDTALNIAARIGNRSIVRLLLSVGADKTLVNKVGLRAGDYGIEEEALQVSAAEAAVSGLRSPPAGPIQKSNEVLADLQQSIESLNAAFQTEISSKTLTLTTNQSHVQSATLALAAERRQLALHQGRLLALAQTEERIRNVERALALETSADFTGRLDALGRPARGVGPAFEYPDEYHSEAVARLEAEGERPLYAGEVEPVMDRSGRVQEGDLEAELVELRKMDAWQGRAERILLDKIQQVQGANAEKRVIYKKVIAICTGTPLELVESMADRLLVSLESDKSANPTAISSFLSRVRRRQGDGS